MGDAGQWILDHRRSLTGHRKQEDKEEREKEKGRAKGKRHFKARPERQVGNDSNTGMNKTDNMSSKLLKSGCFTYKFMLEKKIVQNSIIATRGERFKE